MGRFYIYAYPILQAYMAALPSPIHWPHAESLILDATSGTVICQAGQLRIKGFVATSGLTMRLFLDISDWDLQASPELPACDRARNVEFPMSYELQQIAILAEEAGEEFWFNPQIDKRIDLRVPGEYLILRAQGAPARYQILPRPPGVCRFLLIPHPAQNVVCNSQLKKVLYKLRIALILKLYGGLCRTILK